MQKLWEKLVAGLGGYCKDNGFDKVVMGLSGGIDSAVVAVLAVDALGADKVNCITMPSSNTSALSLDITRKMAKTLSFGYQEFSIEPLLEKARGEFYGLFQNLSLNQVAGENLQARIRGLTLMTFSNQFGALVLACGNKSEADMGYCTLYGDTCGGLEPIGNVYKTDVYALAKWRNGVKKVFPDEVLSRAPSAELAIGQRDQDILPPYDVLDAILKGRDSGLSKAKLAEKFGQDIVNWVFERYEKMAFKREQMPPALPV